MTKKIYILLLLTFGFLLGPTLTYAHNNKAEMACCKKESTSKDCCKEQHHSKEKKHDCDSGCKSVSCGCPSVYCGYTPTLAFQSENNSLLIFQKENKITFIQKSLSHQISVLSGFHLK